MSVILLATVTLLGFEAIVGARHLEGSPEQHNGACSVPDQVERGSCQPVDKCEAYKNILSNESFSWVDRADFLKQVQCGKMDASEVCCPPAGSSYQVLTKEDDICGYQAPQFKIRGGAMTAIDEFPWSALLYTVDRISEENHYYCGGALISRTFVITAAHCIVRKSRDAGDPDTIMVRLREYNLLSEVDCVLYSGFADCADSKLDYAARKLIPHPEFDGKTANRLHDIGLIMIDPVPPYSDFLRPICLSAHTEQTIPFRKLVVAGWGNTDFFHSTQKEGSLSPVKLKAVLPYVRFEDCREQYKAFGVELARSQLCAGGRRAKDACSGDSGNPLMHYNRKAGTWVLDGVASFGLRDCGGADVPGIYTNVAEYSRWIAHVMTTQ